MNNLSEEVLNNVYKNAHIALQSISDVLPECDDEKMCEELRREYDGYEKFIGEAAAFMRENDITPKDVGVMQKAMMWTSIKMKTMTDDSRSHLADMMLKGTVMGISELMQILSREDGSVDPRVLELTEKLKDLEEEYEARLKELL
ncbi:MAG: hypothetical protein J5762_07660 [Clostridia bacterium]|nr:hypothetical protein [Clostridia bacterium]